MTIVSKRLSEITLEDLAELVERGAQETADLEFKRGLPTEDGSEDRWITHGDRIGSYARNRITAELVAFANAEGGTLVLGIAETSEQPSNANELSPIPGCEEIRRRLIDTAEDLIEPRMFGLESRAIAADGEGAGLVIFRVAKSANGPHRLGSDREFYIRRGDRASRMDVREIRERTLEMARSVEQTEGLFAQRREAAFKQFEQLLFPVGTNDYLPILIRATALPLVPLDIIDVTRRSELWWRGKPFRLEADDERIPFEYPSREFALAPSVRLRSLELHKDGFSRILRHDGLVEFRLTLGRPTPNETPPEEERCQAVLPVVWLLGLAVGAVAQVEYLRRELGRDGLDFGLEIEVWCREEPFVRWRDPSFHPTRIQQPSQPLRFPRYHISDTQTLGTIIQLVHRDLFDACSVQSEVSIDVPWNELLP